MKKVLKILSAMQILKFTDMYDTITIENEVLRIFKENCKESCTDLVTKKSLISDLNLSSINYINVFFQIEKKFNLTIEEIIDNIDLKSIRTIDEIIITIKRLIKV